MKLRMLGIAALLVLAPSVMRAQVPPCCTPLSRTSIDQMVPLLRVEVTASNSLDAKLEAVAMMKSTYVALKNSLMVAKLDAATPTRLSTLPFDDGSRATRQANVAVYRLNKARIDAALQGVRADPTCGLCTTAPAAGATRMQKM